jgi:hypothetical protein
MARPLVLDGRNLLEPVAMMERGFEYFSFGRPPEKLTPVFAPAYLPKVASASASAPFAA